MHTFSCALQSVDVDGTPVRFDADPGDYSNCRLYIGDNVLTFHRNGVLLSVAKVEPPPATDEPVDESESVDDPDELLEPEPRPNFGKRPRGV